MSRQNLSRLVFFTALLMLAIACKSSSLTNRVEGAAYGSSAGDFHGYYVDNASGGDAAGLSKDKARGIASGGVPYAGVARASKGAGYILHRGIKTTYFYVGQKDRVRSGFLDNKSSAWMKDWVGAYGGVDSPDRRRGYLPRDFRPRENPFYCALPYNDVAFHGRKTNALRVVPWAKEMEKAPNGEFVSYCKNRWVRITYRKRVCYAQWQDVGPFQTDDWKYVFGTGKPKNRRNGGVGLDLSPACFSYLGMRGSGHTSWQFVDFEDVPPGPWLRVITRSNPSW